MVNSVLGRVDLQVMGSHSVLSDKMGKMRLTRELG